MSQSFKARNQLEAWLDSELIAEKYYQMALIKIRTNDLSVLIWVQTVYKGRLSTDDKSLLARSSLKLKLV